MAGPVQSRIEQCLQATLAPEYLEVVNESAAHNVPPGSESHFRVTVVAAVFVGERPVGRHRLINRLLAEELAGTVHALSIHPFAPDEWRQRDGPVTASPACLGGGAAQSPAGS